MKTISILILMLFPVLLFGQKDRIIAQSLFSSTGDTVLLFGGGIDDSLNFSICRRLVDTLAYLDHFTVVTNNNKISVKDYPASMIKKYNLIVEGECIDVDSCQDIKISQTIISNKKMKRSVTEPSNNIYKAVVSVSISICNKTLLKNFKATKQYMNTSVDNAESLDHTSFYAIKMKSKNIYVLQVQICDTDYQTYKSEKEVKCVTSVFLQRYLIHCP